jgi:hypothetical protein
MKGTRWIHDDLAEEVSKALKRRHRGAILVRF